MQRAIPKKEANQSNVDVVTLAKEAFNQRMPEDLSDVIMNNFHDFAEETSIEEDIVFVVDIMMMKTSDFRDFLTRMRNLPESEQKTVSYVLGQLKMLL